MRASYKRNTASETTRAKLQKILVRYANATADSKTQADTSRQKLCALQYLNDLYPFDDNVCRFQCILSANDQQVGQAEACAGISVTDIHECFGGGSMKFRMRRFVA